MITVCWSVLWPEVNLPFTHEGGSAGLADATRYIAEIPAGESITIYWLIGYDQLDENGVPLWGKSVKPDDDLWLEYDIWATAEEGANTHAMWISPAPTHSVMRFRHLQIKFIRTAPTRFRITSRICLISMFPHGPTLTMTARSAQELSPKVSGMTSVMWGTDLTTMATSFPTRTPGCSLWVTPSIFDSGAFRLMKTYAYVIVKLKGGGEKVLTGEDQLYFENIPENNGAVGFVQYYFMPLLPGARSVTSPYQEVASGFDNEKFNADYGVALGEEIVSGDALVLIDKTADVSAVNPGSSISYTVAYTNSSHKVSAGNRDAGVPLVVQDSIPEGSTYELGSAYSDNTLPTGVTEYKILYSTDGGVTWSTTEPTASEVTDIQWWLDGELDPEEAGSISFSVTVDTSITAPVVENEAGVSFGNTPPFDTDKTTTIVLGNNSLGDTVFADTGVGGGYIGNTIQDGAEPGISGITVSLYYDSNGNGEVDAGETLLGTDVTDAGGNYLFENLPDGNYVAVVDTLDSDLPAGYTVTTEEAIAADLDSGSATSSSVNFLDADFGFAPALNLTKERDGSGTLYEGQEVSYTITVTNSLFGDGSGVGTAAQYIVWPTNGVTGTSNNKSWTDASNAWQPPAQPDGVYAQAPVDNAAENIQVNGYYLGTQPGSVTNVTLVIPLDFIGSFAAESSEYEINVYNDGSSIYASGRTVTQHPLCRDS